MHTKIGGMERERNILLPIFSQEISMQESCNKSCGCRKLGLKCSIFCKTCEEVDCSNSEVPDDAILGMENDNVYYNDSLALNGTAEINLEDTQDAANEGESGNYKIC